MLRLKKTYRVILIILFAFTAFVLLTSAIVSVFYEKAVIRYLKSYLDDHLRTQITVDDIRFRLLKGFPNATFEMRNMMILSGENFSHPGFSSVNADTLLNARRVIFQFDLIGLINSRYVLKQIELSSGTFNLLIDEKNRNNLNIWKNQDSGASRPQTFDMNSIHLNAMNINLVSLPGKFQLFSYTDKMVLKGSVSHDLIAADVKGDLMIHDMLMQSRSQISERTIQLQFSATFQDGEIKMSKGEILYERTPCLFSGLAKTGHSGNSCHIELEIPDFRLEELMTFLSDMQTNDPFPFDLEGKGKITGSLDGTFGSVSPSWSFHSDFEMQKAKATRSISGKSITNINCSGIATGTLPGSISFQIRQYTSSLSEGVISGEYTWSGQQQKILALQTNSIINLNDLYYLIEYDSIKNMNGFVSADFGLTWPLARGEPFSLGNFLSNMTRGKFLAQDVTLELGNGTNLQDISGRFTYDESLKLDSVSIILDQNRYMLNGTMDDLPEYFLHQGNLVAKLAVVAEIIDLSSYLPSKSEIREEMPVRKLSFPARLDLNATIHANIFSLNQFQANGLVVDFALKQNESFINSFNFNFLDGSISGNALITENISDGFSVTCNAKTSYIDIHELFKAFNNFAQHFIVEENVRGRLDGTVMFSAEWDSTFRLMPGTIKALADIEIQNGELVEFEPMMKLSRYIDADELMSVRFSTLKNQIMIGDRMVTIPEMEIHSSAFNITASGNHSFDNVFDYRLRILLSEMLFNRARNRRSEINEFFVEEDIRDQAGIPLVIAGIPENYDVQLDRKRAFDLSGQNSNKSGVSEQNNTDPSDFIIEWDKPDEERVSQGGKDTGSSEEEFIFQWDDDEDETGM